MFLVLILGAAMAGLTVALLLRGVAVGRTRDRRALAQIGAWGFGAPVKAHHDRRDLSTLTSDLAFRVGAYFERRLGPERQRELRTLLNSAGLYRMTVARYLGYRALAAGVPPVLILVLMGASGQITATAFVLAIAFAGLAWAGGPFLVKRRARIRLEQIDYEVPELVDLLVTTVEAGDRLCGGPAAERTADARSARRGAAADAARAEHGTRHERVAQEPAHACEQPRAALLRPGDPAGRDARRLDRQDPARPGRGHAHVAAARRPRSGPRRPRRSCSSRSSC